MSEDVRYQGKGDGLNNDTYYAMKKKKVVEEEKLSFSSSSSWKRRLELTLVILYALSFYLIIIPRSIQLSNVNKDKLRQELRPGYMGPGWMGKDTLNDASDAQWRNFRGNLPLLSLVFAIFTLIAITLRATFRLKGRAMSHVWLTISLLYLFYLHGACVLFILFITSLNFLLVKMTARFKCFPFVLWIYNIFWLICNRIYNGYSFTSIGQSFAFLDNYRGTFWWHICFNFVVLRMISFGFDYYWAHKSTHFDQKKHVQRCPICSSGKKCYHLLQERSVPLDKFSFSIYLCYLFYAPLYIAGPIISFNAFASQLDTPQKNYSIGSVAWYGLRWILLLSLMELMTHFCYFNAFVIRGSWTGLSPFEVFIIGYGVLNFMWLKFLLIWRYFRFWSLIAGIEAPENMPGCINNCYNLESFWKNWHASFNKWLVRYIYIPLGGYHRKELNLLVIFPFVAIWHELEWKLLLWAGLTCLFFKLEMQMKSASNTFQAKNAFEQFILREVRALTGAITITCLMVANLVGYVIGSDITLFVSKFLHKDGLPVLGGMFATFYVGTKLMFYIQEAKERRQKILETTRY